MSLLWGEIHCPPEQRGFDDDHEAAWIATGWDLPRLPAEDIETWARARLMAAANYAQWRAVFTTDYGDAASVESFAAEVREMEDLLAGLRMELERRWRALREDAA